MQDRSCLCSRPRRYNFANQGANGWPCRRPCKWPMSCSSSTHSNRPDRLLSQRRSIWAYKCRNWRIGFWSQQNYSNIILKWHLTSYNLQYCRLYSLKSNCKSYTLPRSVNRLHKLPNCPHTRKHRHKLLRWASNAVPRRSRCRLSCCYSSYSPPNYSSRARTAYPIAHIHPHTHIPNHSSSNAPPYHKSCTKSLSCIRCSRRCSQCKDGSHSRFVKRWAYSCRWTLRATSSLWCCRLNNPWLCRSCSLRCRENISLGRFYNNR